MIEQHKSKGGGKTYEVESEKGDKSLGTYKSKKEALRRLAQVEYFKSHPEKSAKDVKKVGPKEEEQEAKGKPDLPLPIRK